VNRISKSPRDNNEMKENRRKFLKYLLIGSGIFLLGKLLGTRLSSSNKSSSEEDAKEYLFKNFRIKETDKELSFYESDGDEILIIEKGGME